jgi:hypothetical protein
MAAEHVGVQLGESQNFYIIVIITLALVFFHPKRPILEINYQQGIDCVLVFDVFLRFIWFVHLFDHCHFCVSIWTDGLNLHVFSP